MRLPMQETVDSPTHLRLPHPFEPTAAPNYPIYPTSFLVLADALNPLHCKNVRVFLHEWPILLMPLPDGFFLSVSFLLRALFFVAIDPVTRFDVLAELRSGGKLRIIATGSARQRVR